MDETGRTVITKYLEAYPQMENRTLARLICKENSAILFDVEQVRSVIRYRRGAIGAENLYKLADTTCLTSEKLALKYDIPRPIKRHDFKPFQLYKNKVLFMADHHFPFHCPDTIAATIDYAKNQNLDGICLLGDVMDCYAESKFDKTESEATMELEIEQCQNYLKILKKEFPDVPIYYKFGNHEKRFQRYISDNAPALMGIKGMNLQSFLKLDELGVTYIPEWQTIDLGGPQAIHGHEFGGWISNAKQLWAKAKTTSICAHNHTKTEEGSRTLSGEITGTWTIGCQCDLNPAYRPYNGWNNGFGLFSRHDEMLWTFDNKLVINGNVL